LALSGARYDPAFLERTCEAKPGGWSEDWWNGVCADPEDWLEVVERAKALGLPEPDGLWRALGDERIRAVMPMGPQGFEVYGPSGLAHATASALFIAAGSDVENDYDPATTDLYAHYPDAELITFVGAGHIMIEQLDVGSLIRMFATAFFGFHLAGDDRYEPLLTREFVEEDALGLVEASSFKSLAWGVVED
jgi:predicted dienelactone hydrolase